MNRMLGQGPEVVLQGRLVFCAVVVVAVFSVFGVRLFQLQIVEGEVLRLEKLDAEPGSTVDLTALMVGEGAEVTVGTPVVEGAKVTAEVVAHGKGDKVNIIKFKRRKNYVRHAGHRQWYTEVKITGISA